MEQKIIKDYFTEEVSKKKVPPFSRNHKKTERNWKDLAIVAASVSFALFTVVNPSTYDNKVRSINLTTSQYEAFKNTIPRVIYDASVYMQQKEGISIKSTLFIKK